MTDPQGNEVVVMGPLAARKAAAEVRVAAALELIQEAQRLLDRAAQALSAVNGLCVEYEKLGRFYDQVHQAWYAVRDKADAVGRRGRLTLDHEPDEYEARWARERLS